jgi:Ca2+-binding EF-hand superfamily protein
VNAGVSSQFSKYDKNADGFIEKEEVVSANAPPASKQP